MPFEESQVNVPEHIHVCLDVSDLRSNVGDLKSDVSDLSNPENINTLLSASYQNNLAASSSKIDIFPERLKLKICFHYINGNCTNSKCPRLHMCKNFLISEFTCKEANCLYGLSHDPFDEHNKLIIEKKNVITPTKTKVLHVLRNSFPRVCRDYSSGKCKSLVCGKIHICSNVFSNKICMKMDCFLSHDIQDVHNSLVLKTYSLDVNAKQKLKMSYVLANVLYSIQTDVNHLNQTSARPVSSTDLASKSSTSNLAYPESPETLDTEYKLFLCKHDTGEVVTRKDFAVSSTDLASKSFTSKLAFPENPGTLGTEYKPFLCKYDTGEAVSRRNFTSCSNFSSVEALPVTYPRVAVENNESLLGAMLKAAFKGSLATKPCYNYTKELLRPCFNQPPPIDPKLRKRNQVKKTETINSDPIYTKKEQANSANSCHASTAARPNLDLSSLKKSATSFVEPSEIDIFAYILNHARNRGFIFTRELADARLFGDLDFSQDRIGVNEIVSRWFEKYLYTFRIVREESAGIYGDSYYLCVDTIAPCYEYWANNCRNTNCDKFHLCKKFVHGIQHSGISCSYNHSFKDQHEQQLISKYNLQPLSEEQLTLLLKVRYPSVCEVYLSYGCVDKGNICQYVHICGDFLEGKCAKPEGLCNYNHELGLTGGQAIRLMKEFHIDGPGDFKKCIIYWKSDPKHSWKYQSHHKALKANFDWLTNEAICYKHINGECEPCNVFHLDTGLPYAWQYYENDWWNMFDAHLNVDIEKCFCDPNSELFDSYAVNKSQSKRLVIPKDRDWKSAIFGRAPVVIRRLSTKSSVLVKDEEAAGLTKWKWFWKNGNTWDEYTKWTTSSSIETVFLKTPNGTFTFSTDEFKYSLSFVSMQQQNMDERYFTKREVRRRPVYKTKQDMRSVTQVITVKNQLPWHWPVKDPNLSLKGGRIDVDSSARKKIENAFKASMNHGVNVLDVEEVCNAEFYESYQSKKRSLKARNGSSGVNELSLYHGTDHTVVDGICAQNFDWRLCGKNAKYGQGSYFAKNASYSHNYTTPDSKNPRYMFVAQVLVGRYAKGNSTMKRPPAVNPSVDAHTLYDSCVDDQNNPSIYVIFERDQCYPQYLITYTDTVTGNYYNRQYPVTSHVPKQRPQPLKTPPKTPLTTPPKLSLSRVSTNYSTAGLNTINSSSNSTSNSNIYNNNSNSRYNRRSSSGSNNDNKKCVMS